MKRPRNLELKRHSPHDADAMHRFQADLTRYSQLIRKTLMRTPPDPTSFRPRDIMEMLYLAKQFWSLGEKELYEYVRFFTMSAAEFLDDYFENDLIKAAMASPGIIGTALGVYSPGSAYILLHHVMGDVDGSIGAWGLARGGMGAISKAIAGALAGTRRRAFAPTPACSRCWSATARPWVSCSKTATSSIAGIVVSNLDAKRTFTKIMDQTTCPMAFTRRPRTSRSAAPRARSILPCPECRNSPACPITATSIAADRALPARLETMERAYDCWKRGRWSDDPFIESVIPSAWDPTVAPPGQALDVQLHPVLPAGAGRRPWTPEKRDLRRRP